MKTRSTKKSQAKTKRSNSSTLKTLQRATALSANPHTNCQYWLDKKGLVRVMGCHHHRRSAQGSTKSLLKTATIKYDSMLHDNEQPACCQCNYQETNCKITTAITKMPVKKIHRNFVCYAVILLSHTCINLAVNE